MEHGSFTAPIGPISRDKQDFSWGIEATTTMMFAGKDGWNMVEQSLKKSSNNAQAGANFQNLVRTIASRVEGWTVEVWCWRSSCHSCYKRMARAGEIRLYFLDGLRKEVTMTAGKTAPALAGSAVPPNEGLEHEDTCVQCLMAEATYAFNPCNHRILCRECAMETRPHWNTRPLGLCFLCRCPWDDITACDTIAI